MAKKCYIGNTSISRNIKSMYIGVDGIARKVKKGYIGVNGIARLFYEPLEAGHYWLITTSGTKEYTVNGILVASNTNNTSWDCPDSGEYTVEIHGYGGPGGTGEYQGVAERINYQWHRSYAAACGGAGGGSGAIYTLSLVSGISYPIIIASSSGGYSKFDQYQVNAGGTGGDASVGVYSATTQGSYTVGKAGKVATFTSGGTNIAKYKESTYDMGSADIYASSFSGITGPDGQSGGATIGDYGTGGKGGNAPSSWGTISSSSSSDPGEQGKPGAIIIRKV